MQNVYTAHPRAVANDIVGWFALEGSTEPCLQCGSQPAVVCHRGRLLIRICNVCARLAGCPADIVKKGLSAHGPRARIHGLTSARNAPWLPVARAAAQSPAPKQPSEAGQKALGASA